MKRDGTVIAFVIGGEDPGVLLGDCDDALDASGVVV